METGSRKSLDRTQSEMTPVEGKDRDVTQSGEPVRVSVDDDGMETIEMGTVEDRVTEEQPQSKEKQIEDEIDYSNRDPNDIHAEVKVNFADIIAEPSGAHSFETVWGTSYKVYSVTKYWIYRIMSLIFGIPASLFWGIYFSCLAFCSIWCITPCIRSCIIKINFVGRLWGACVNTVLDPCFESIGLVLSRVRVAMTVRRED